MFDQLANASLENTFNDAQRNGTTAEKLAIEPSVSSSEQSALPIVPPGTKEDTWQSRISISQTVASELEDAAVTKVNQEIGTQLTQRDMSLLARTVIASSKTEIIVDPPKEPSKVEHQTNLTVEQNQTEKQSEQNVIDVWNQEELNENISAENLEQLDKETLLATQNMEELQDVYNLFLDDQGLEDPWSTSQVTALTEEQPVVMASKAEDRQYSTPVEISVPEMTPAGQSVQTKPQFVKVADQPVIKESLLTTSEAQESPLTKNSISLQDLDHLDLSVRPT
jgi:hypothetical protein